ncbi:MAG: alpha/beta fold hydrolase, partial [Longimicrobiales bacterium]
AALSRVSRPVVVELYGHGRSSSREDPAAYHPDAYVAEFECIRALVGAERWAICGQSLGAALTRGCPRSC